MRWRWIAAGAAGLIALLGLFGCSSATVQGGTGDASSESQSTSSESDFSTIAASFDASMLDLGYSDRDQDASYDESSATRISLSGSTASVDGSGATVDGSVVTVVQEGVYVVSGSLDDGQLVVEAEDDAKVQLVLEGVDIHNDDGPAIYVKQADKCFITLAAGTANTLTDGSDYTLEDDSDEPNATLFSHDDLTLNGTGTLQVTGSYRHAICSKDDLVITGGTYVVDAAEDGLRGRDCVKIQDGNVSVTAGGDGIKSNNDGDATRGFVSIDGGTVDITAGDDGIQSVTYLRVAGGELKVEAADDAFHSDLELLLSGGEMTAEAGDDAFHAETKLVVDGGTVDVFGCYEGYEAEKIYVNGGNTHIVATDDAVNASAADLTGDAEEDTSATSASRGFSAGETSGETEGEPSGGEAPAGGGGGNANESELNGGAPDNAFAEGAGNGGMTMGDENCLIQMNGGSLVLDAEGDGVDSNGSVEVTGGVLLVNGPSSSNDGAFDYDLEATVTGGTVLMVGSTGMAQNFTSGTQPFSFSSVSGSAGQSVAVVDGDGTVVASLTAARQFGMVLASSPAFVEGGSYSIVVGGSVSGANADGYTDDGSVDGGSTTDAQASTTASGGVGGLGSDGNPLGAGQGGDVQRSGRGTMG